MRIGETFSWKHFGHLMALIVLGVGFGAGLLLLFGADSLSPIAFGNIPEALGLSVPKEGKAVKIDLESRTGFLYDDGAIVRTFPLAFIPPADSLWQIKSGKYEVMAKEAEHLSPIGLIKFKYALSLGENRMIHELASDAKAKGGVGLAPEDASTLFSFVEMETPVLVVSEGPFERIAFPKPDPLQLSSLLANLSVKTSVLGAGAYVVGDLDTGEILLEKNKDKIVPIASVSKLFTALVAQDLVRASESLPRSSKFKVNYDELLYPLLLESSNAAADELANLAGRTRFISAMNEKAQELRLSSTSFKDPSGLSPSNKSTANDLFALAEHLFKNKQNLLELTTEQGYKQWTNRNRLVRGRDTTYIGGKVGFIPEAGQTWVALFSYPLSEFERKNIAVVVLGSSNRYRDVAAVTAAVSKGLYAPEGSGSALLARFSPASVPETQRLVFVGDIMLDRGVESSIRKNGKGDYSFIFEQAYFLKEADLTFGNLEGPISDKGYDLKNLYSFRMHPDALVALRSAGFDVLSVANNHIGDWGRAAFEDTLARLSDAGVVATGAGNNRADSHKVKIVEKNGVKIGFLAFTDVGPDWLSEPTNLPVIQLASDPEFASIISGAKGQVDILVTSFHFGNEYETEPSPRQRTLARAAVDAGADIVVGHHPHVAQPIERYKDSVIAYSLGNFIFDQNFSEKTLEGAVLEVTLEGKRMKDALLHTTRQNQFLQPILDDEFEF